MSRPRSRPDTAVAPAAPEFSRVFAIGPGTGSGAGALRFSVEANAEERAALARRFGLLSLDALGAEGRIEVFGGGFRARLTATVRAELSQSCVVTLEPVRARVVESFSRDYEKGAVAGPLEVDVEVEGEDPPERLPAAGIDVGEAVAEQLGLAIDPYPRAPGAVLGAGGGPETGTGGGGAKSRSPFAILERLRRR